MNPKELLGTVYLGDRGCKAICLYGSERRVTVAVDLISRIRSGTGLWNYYSAEDIPDGRLVFENALHVIFEPQGFIPNDVIHSIEVMDVESTGASSALYKFVLSTGSVDGAGNSTEVTIEIVASGLYLEDPRDPGHQIRG